MRRRLMLAEVGVAGLIVTVLAVWLAVAIAEQETRAAVGDHLTENLGLLDTLGPAIRAGDAEEIGRLLHEHEAQTGSGVVIFADDGTTVATSRPDLLPLSAEQDARVRAALSGVVSTPDDPVWPWDRGPLVLAAPFIGADGGLSGAALAVMPSGPVRHTITTGWSILAACVVLSLLAIGAVTEGVARWIAAPVHRLTDAVGALEPGQSLGRGGRGPRDRSMADGGPPELRALALALDDVSQRLRTVASRQSMFVSQASHQLRAPLAALRLRTEALGSALPEEACAEHALLIEEIDRLAGICDTLLAFARTRPVEGVADVDLSSVVDGRVAAWAPVANEHGVSLRRTEGHAAARVAVDVLEQVVDVLLDNAIRYAGAGATVAIGVRYLLDDTGTYGAIDIEDDGPGMSAVELARAATPFWRGAGAQSGSGLGLTIASALTEAAGGRLHLSRVDPHGLHARVRLPSAGIDHGGGPRRVEAGFRRSDVRTHGARLR